MHLVKIGSPSVRHSLETEHSRPLQSEVYERCIEVDLIKPIRVMLSRRHVRNTFTHEARPTRHY